MDQSAWAYKYHQPIPLFLEQRSAPLVCTIITEPHLLLALECHRSQSTDINRISLILLIIYRWVVNLPLFNLPQVQAGYTSDARGSFSRDA